MRRIAAALLLWLVGGAATAQLPADSEAGRLAQFMESYFREPRPLDAIDRLVRADIDGIVGGDAATGRFSLAVLSAFYAHVLHDNPHLAAGVADLLATRGLRDNALVGAFALATAAIAAGPPALQRLEARGMLPPGGAADLLTRVAPYPFPNLVPSRPPDIELLWVSFYATGDSRYLTRIASVLARRSTDNPTTPAEEASRQMTQIVARETLAERALRVPEVRRALQRLAISNDPSGAIAGILAEVERVLAGGNR